MDENDAVWVEMPEGGLLRDLFGFWPTFHNAVLRSVEFDPASERLLMTVDYADEAVDGDSELEVVVEFIFGGVQSVDLGLRGNDVDQIRFRKRSDFIETNMEFCDGSEGKIVSETVDASVKRLDPGPGDSDETVRLIYRRRA